jgi:glutamyl-tRNA synthetase
MTQFDLTVATRGSHAALLPVVLIATSINEARPTPVINIKYEDTALLNEGDKAILQLSTAGKSVFGTIPAIQELCAHFPYLVGKDATVVSCPAG